MFISIVIPAFAGMTHGAGMTLKSDAGTHSTTPIIVPYDIPLKNIQDMAYGTSKITTYGIFKMTYGVIKAWLDVRPARNAFGWSW